MTMKRKQPQQVPAGQDRINRYVKGDLSLGELYQWAGDYLASRKLSAPDGSLAIARLLEAQALSFADRIAKLDEAIKANPDQAAELVAALNTAVTTENGPFNHVATGAQHTDQPIRIKEQSTARGAGNAKPLAQGRSRTPV